MITAFADAKLARYYDISDAALGNGTPVGTLLDQSANAAHLSAATSLPSVQHPSLNGLDAVQFSGTNNPLTSSVGFELRAGFAVLRIDETASFSNYAGILTDLTTNGVLVGNQGTANFYDFQWNFLKSNIRSFEYRLSDRIYPAANAPAPVNVYRVIFFRLWMPLQMDGLQIGKDRGDAARKGKFSLAFLALYSRDFCESEIRAKSQLLATRYNLPISDVFPYQADSDVETNNTLPANLDFPESGGMIAETLGVRGIESNLKFTGRTNSEAQTAEKFLDDHYATAGFVYRSYRFLPPRDSFGYATAPLTDSGDPGRGASKNYQFPFRGDR